MKESYFFSHDYNARQDPKMQEVLMDYGVAGIGIYWCIIEQLYEQGGRMPLSSIKAIAFTLHANIEDVQGIIDNSGLFENDGVEFWSPSVSRRLETRKTTSEKKSKAASKRWSTDADASKNNASVMQVHQKTMQMHNTSDAGAMQDCEEVGTVQCYKKKIKEKEIKENNNLSLTPSLGDESAAEPQIEREQFLEIFFFRNFRSPLAEVDRFIAHYQANGWCRNNSTRPVKDRAALARCWEPLDKDYQKFPTDFLSKWKCLYEVAKARNTQCAIKLLTDIYKVEISSRELTICASKELREMMYRNSDFFNSEFFVKYYNDKKLVWT